MSSFFQSSRPSYESKDIIFVFTSTTLISSALCISSNPCSPVSPKWYDFWHIFHCAKAETGLQHVNLRHGIRLRPISRCVCVCVFFFYIVQIERHCLPSWYCCRIAKRTSSLNAYPDTTMLHESCQTNTILCNIQICSQKRLDIFKLIQLQPTSCKIL